MRRKCSASHGWWASERRHGLLWDGYFLMWLCRVCAWERYRYTDIQREIQTDCLETTKEDSQNAIFVLALWSALDSLFYAIVIFFPSVLGLFCYVSSQLGSRARACVSSCVRVCFIPHFSSYQFVAVLSGTSECARLSFYRFPLPRQCRA